MSSSKFFAGSRQNFPVDVCKKMIRSGSGAQRPIWEPYLIRMRTVQVWQSAVRLQEPVRFHLTYEDAYMHVHLGDSRCWTTGVMTTGTKLLWIRASACLIKSLRTDVISIVYFPCSPGRSTSLYLRRVIRTITYAIIYIPLKCVCDMDWLDERGNLRESKIEIIFMEKLRLKKSRENYACFKSLFVSFRYLDRLLRYKGSKFSMSA